MDRTAGRSAVGEALATSFGVAFGLVLGIGLGVLALIAIIVACAGLAPDSPDRPNIAAARRRFVGPRLAHMAEHSADPDEDRGSRG